MRIKFLSKRANIVHIKLFALINWIQSPVLSKEFIVCSKNLLFHQLKIYYSVKFINVTMMFNCNIFFLLTREPFWITNTYIKHNNIIFFTFWGYHTSNKMNPSTLSKLLQKSFYTWDNSKHSRCLMILFVMLDKLCKKFQGIYSTKAKWTQTQKIDQLLVCTFSFSAHILTRSIVNHLS